MLLSNIALCIMPFFSVWCFYAGYKVGRKEKIPVVKMESPAEKKRVRERTKEQRKQTERFLTLQRNLENYKGNAEGQEKL